MTILSQRDPQWANIQLGTSPYTIGSHGCTITALAMFIGTTPDYVNKRLLEVNGYAQGCLVIWAKVKEAFPGVYIEEPYIRMYDNDAVLASIPCLVEVDFDGTLRTDDRHWVVFTGNKQMYDPWTGTVESTSKYPLVGYRAIKGQWTEKQEALNYEQLYNDKRIECDKNWNMGTEVIAFLGVTVTGDRDKMVQQSKLAIETLKTEARTNKQIAEENWKKYEQEQIKVRDLNEANAKISSENQNDVEKVVDAEHLAKNRGDYINAIADEAGIPYAPENEKQIVEDILDMIANAKTQDETVTETVKNYPQGMPVEVVRTNIFTKVLNLFFQ